MQDPIKAMYQSGRYEEPSYETPPREPSPVPLQEPPRIPIPVYHRALLPGEAIRRGDKVLAAGSEKWIKVEESLRGTLVSNGEAGNNGEAGPCYCRPVHPYSQTWYVDLRPGRRLIRQASERYSVSRFD